MSNARKNYISGVMFTTFDMLALKIHPLHKHLYSSRQAVTSLVLNSHIHI